MGLDGVELIMAIEAGFGVEIPDAAAERMTCPRDVITYLEEALPLGGSGVCLTQRAFYCLRDRCADRLRVSPDALRPQTPLHEVLDPHANPGEWEAIGADLGTERWPSPRSATWWGRQFQWERPATVGEAARYAATGTREPSRVLTTVGRARKLNAPWSGSSKWRSESTCDALRWTPSSCVTWESIEISAPVT